jgi:hypothetical protein
MNGLEITLAVVGCVGSLGIGGFLFNQWQQSTREQDRRLKTHFEDLKSKVGDPLVSSASGVDVQCGELVLSPLDRNQDFRDFARHFDEDVKRLEQQERRVEAHNRDSYGPLCAKIESIFASRGISVCRDDAFDRTTTYVGQGAFKGLFQRWNELARGNPHPFPDFGQIEAKKADGGYLLFASAWASYVAFVEEKDIDSVKSVLVEVVDNKELQNEAANVIRSANELAKETEEFGTELSEKLDAIGKSLPNRKRFKKLGGCTYCRGYV